jgi:hypothetical protein
VGKFGLPFRNSKPKVEMESAAIQVGEVSISNQVDLLPLSLDDRFYQVNDSDGIYLFGTNYIYRLKLKGSKSLLQGRYPNFENWVSHVLHAGICLLSTEKPGLNLKIGIGLKDFYQNYQLFGNIIAVKKVRFLYNGKLRAKPIRIRRYSIYPNLYGQAKWVAETKGLDEFVVVNMGMENFEGIFYKEVDSHLKQRYVLGYGLSELVRRQEAGSHFETSLLLDEIENFKSTRGADYQQFFTGHLKKKLDFICRGKRSLKIFVVENEEIDSSFRSFFVDKLGNYGDVSSIGLGDTAAVNGLYGIKVGRKSPIVEDVAVSISPDFTTFFTGHPDE